MGEGKYKPNPEEVLRQFLEPIYGSQVYEKYVEALREGKFASDEDAARFLRDKALNLKSGKMLTAHQLDAVIEKVEKGTEIVQEDVEAAKDEIIAEIRDERGDLVKVIEDLSKLSKIKTALSSLKNHAAYFEKKLYEIAQAKGFDKEPVYDFRRGDQRGQRFEKEFIEELLVYISAHSEGEDSVVLKQTLKELEAAKTVLEKEANKAEKVIKVYNKYSDHFEAKLIELARAKGFDKEPVYVNNGVKRLHHNYINEVFVYLTEHVGNEELNELQGQLQELRGANKNLEGEVLDVQQSNRELSTQVSGLEAEKGALQDETHGLKEQVLALQELVDMYTVLQEVAEQKVEEFKEAE